MAISVFDLFKVGIGPSSSHTVGPMRAAAAFAHHLHQKGLISRVVDLNVDLYGSLAATGKGHGTFNAVLLGLEGYEPDKVTQTEIATVSNRLSSGGPLLLAEKQEQGGKRINFNAQDITLRPLTVLPRHTNGMKFLALNAKQETIFTETYFSVGGGFIIKEGSEETVLNRLENEVGTHPYPFTTGAKLLEHCTKNDLKISDVMLANEVTHRSQKEIFAGLQNIWDVMEECKNSALNRDGVLPGGLNVRRRAPKWHQKMLQKDPDRDPVYWQEWVNLVALAINEENASGGRVVTAPTNGAAGIIPAVMFYATHYAPGAKNWNAETKQQVIANFLLTAAAIGVLFKEQASISGAEVGCQGEVGSASAMAAAGLAEILGGTPEQVENAAEIAMEHNLGLTCDPIGGLVQIPCIERNAIAASKAINAAKMALMGDGKHHVTLDEVIVTMRETGKDMLDKYKETAMGALAVNVTVC